MIIASWNLPVDRVLLKRVGFRLPMTARFSNRSLSPSIASKLLPLELCRGLAAVLVTFVHVGASIEKHYGFEIGAVHNFGAGVDFFFVLSGFVMTYAHWHDIGRPQRVRGYCIKRLLRIYPPYWIVTAAIVAFYILVPSYDGLGRLDPTKLFCSILLLPYTTQPVVGQAWTLVHEMFFYGLFSLVILFGRRAFIGLVLWAACILFWQALHVSDYRADPLFAFPVSFFLSPFNIEFIFGVGVGLLVRRGWHHFSRTLASTGIVLFVLGLIFVDYRVVGDLAARLAFGGSAAIAVLGLASLPSRLSVGLAVTAGVLGATSYSLYLVHPGVETAVIYVLLKFGGAPQSPWALMVVLVCSAIAGGMLFAYGVERPLNRILQAHFLPRPVQAAPLPLSLIVQGTAPGSSSSALPPERARAGSDD
jgi:exopolysaccharide production protein ExoZ